jgi:hypothetical protein
MDQIIQKFNFKYEKNTENIDINKITALGIGDIVITLVLLQYKLIEGPIYINLKYFKENIIYDNPLNFLEFRLKLINHLCFINAIDSNQIILLNENNNFNSLNQHINLISKINNFKLKFDIKLLPTKLLNNKYIVFHTKCRFLGSFDYNKLKKDLKIYYQNFKTNYTIVILGEREIKPYDGELIHGITTIYNELIELKNHNNIVDLSVKNIYKELNFDNYLNDISIIHNAEYNIVIGLGGHFVSSLVFSKGPVINYISNLFNFNFITKQDNITKEFCEYIKIIDEINL